MTGKRRLLKSDKRHAQTVRKFSKRQTKQSRVERRVYRMEQIETVEAADKKATANTERPDSVVGHQAWYPVGLGNIPNISARVSTHTCVANPNPTHADT